MALIEFTVFWGNDDADSSIKLSSSNWEKIQLGAEFEKSTWSYYEGKRSRVRWAFKDKHFSIFGEDGEEFICDEPIENLIQQTSK